MNDWTRIKAALDADPDLKPERKKEIWRWTSLARVWLDTNQIEVANVVRGDMLQFVHDVEPTSGPTSRSSRLWALKWLIQVAVTVSARRVRVGGTAVARLDLVPERSPLGKAIAAVIARARSEGDRRRWLTCLGAFIAWCDLRQIPADDCWPGDIDAYRRHRLEQGFTSPGEYTRVARFLLAELEALRVSDARR